MMRAAMILVTFQFLGRGVLTRETYRPFGAQSGAGPADGWGQSEPKRPRRKATVNRPTVHTAPGPTAIVAARFCPEPRITR